MCPCEQPSETGICLVCNSPRHVTSSFTSRLKKKVLGSHIYSVTPHLPLVKCSIRLFKFAKPENKVGFQLYIAFL